MITNQAYELFSNIQAYYDAIEHPKYRNVDLLILNEKYQLLLGLKNDLGHDAAYIKLINAISQIIAKLMKREDLEKTPDDQLHWNLSERGMNKVIPAVLRTKDHTFPIEWTDKWGNTCSVSNGDWTAKNYRVMDVLGYMLVMKTGGDRLPEHPAPIFDDLFEVEQRENQLNGLTTVSTRIMSQHSIGFTDENFRRYTGLKMSSADILQLILDTSRVEFKLSFPLRLKSTGNKEVVHRMNFYSRFFELSYQDLKVRSDNIIQGRKYRVIFSTLLGEFFVNNLLARYNDKIDLKFYQLPASAQIFYRRMLIHHNFKSSGFYLSKIAEVVGLRDSNISNLTKTVETNILEPLKRYGYIDSYEKLLNGKGIKYVIKRFQDAETTTKREAGSVKEGCRVGK
jgi:hypothetical protein